MEYKSIALASIPISTSSSGLNETNAFTCDTPVQ
jgi:hypothetical protein